MGVNHLLLARSSKRPSKAKTMKWKILFPLVLIIVPAIFAVPFDDEEDDIEEFERLRRVPMIMPQNYFYRAPMASFFDYDEEESDDMDRRKKSIYRYFNFDRYNDDDDEYDRKKKGVYLLPSMKWSNLFDKKGVLWKRYFKRSAKRNLIDAFTQGDPTSFGYDKKKRSDDGEEDEDRKRKKKSM